MDDLFPLTMALANSVQNYNEITQVYICIKLIGMQQRAAVVWEQAKLTQT